MDNVQYSVHKINTKIPEDFPRDMTKNVYVKDSEGFVVKKAADQVLPDETVISAEEFRKLSGDDYYEEHYGHGEKREGAGRKAKYGEPLDHQMRVSAQEMVFLKYARKNHLDYSKLMSAK